MVRPVKPSPLIQVLMRHAIGCAAFVKSVNQPGLVGRDLLQRAESKMRADVPGKTDDEIRLLVLEAVSEALWAGSGFQRVNLGHKLAALMMSTNVPADVIDVIDVPWRAFLLDVPVGLIEASAAPVVTHALVSRASDGDVLLVALDCSRSDQPVLQTAFYVKRMLGDEYRDSEHMSMRSMKALARLALGVCVELMSHRPSVRAGTAKTGRRDHRDGDPPETPTYTITSDIKIDCREAVREYCRGAGRTSSKTDVQSFVRGYWKMQPHGPGNSQRRLQQISPHWRGDKTGPIALRSFILNGKQD